MNKPSRQELAAAIARLMQAGLDSGRLARSVAAYLLSERRTGELSSLMRDISRSRYETGGLLEIDVASAHALNAEIRTEIKRLLPAKRQLLAETIEPALLGGLKLTALDWQFDDSIHARLNKLKQEVI